MSQLQSQKRKTPVYGNDTVLESLRDVGSSIGSSVVKDVVAKTGADIVQSFFGGIPKTGELRANQVIELGRRPEVAPAPVRPNPESMQSIRRSEDQEVKEKIEKIRNELKALSQSVKNLRQEIAKTVMDVPVNPGVYHVNFFEQLQSYLQAMKQEIDDSRTWLAAANNRKARKGYWGMYKKHGTTFGMSHERNLATSSG